MAHLPDIDITIGLVNNTLRAGSFDDGTLCCHPNNNPLSYYGPGLPGVDVNKNIIFVPPVVKYPLDDFRRYDHQAIPPHAQNASDTYNWGPTATIAVNVVIPWVAEDVNYKAFAEPPVRVMMKLYATPEHRIAEGPVVKSASGVLSYVSAGTPLAGHSRQSTERLSSGINTLTCTFSTIDLAGLIIPGSEYIDHVFYGELYFTDGFDARKVNFGTKRGGDFSIVMHRVKAPYLTGRNTNIPYPAPGMVALFPKVKAGGTNICDKVNGSYIYQLDQTFGQTTFDFWVYGWCPAYNDIGRDGLPDGNHYAVVALSNAVINLEYDGASMQVHNGPLTTSGVRIQGTLPGGKTWQYDKFAEIKFVTGSTVLQLPDYTKCV